jgi:hypothetical protein
MAQRPPSPDEPDPLAEARRKALEVYFGPSQDARSSSLVPDIVGDTCSVLEFRPEPDIRIYATACFTGTYPEGTGELIIVTDSTGEEWGAGLAAELGRYQRALLDDLDDQSASQAGDQPDDATPLDSGHTMDVEDVFAQMHEGTLITTLFFVAMEPTPPLSVAGKRYSLLYVVGITDDEYEYMQHHDAQQLIDRLEDAGVFPGVFLYRESALEPQDED